MKPAEFRPAEKYDTNPYYDTTEWPGYVEPTGTIEITENGEVDVTQYAKANINIEGGTEYDIKCYIQADENTIEETTDQMLLFDSSTKTPSSEPVNKAKGGDLLVTTSSVLFAVLCESFPPDVENDLSVPVSHDAIVMPNGKLAVIVDTSEIH